MNAILSLYWSLTWSGRLLTLWCVAVTILFIVRCISRNWIGVHQHVYLMVALWAWVLYLVTP